MLSFGDQDLCDSCRSRCTQARDMPWSRGNGAECADFFGEAFRCNQRRLYVDRCRDLRFLLIAFLSAGTEASEQKSRDEETGAKSDHGLTVRVRTRSAASAIQISATSSTYWRRTSRADRCASRTLDSGNAPARYAVTDIDATRFADASSVRSRTARLY